MQRNLKFKPLKDRVLIERSEAQNKTTGGIIIPDSAKEKPVEGEIIATGDGKVTFADILKGRGVINGKKKGKK